MNTRGGRQEEPCWISSSRKDQVLIVPCFPIDIGPLLNRGKYSLHLKGRSSSTEFPLHNFLTEVLHSHYSIFYSIKHFHHIVTVSVSITQAPVHISLVRHPYLICSSQKIGVCGTAPIGHITSDNEWSVTVLDATSLSKLLSSIRAILSVVCFHSFDSFDTTQIAEANTWGQQKAGFCKSSHSLYLRY
ncbi:hypothetical protein EYC84_007775 [Monilinia fructicola]|uniref:Uncharacterized protein n=1 Tax=Monilinia fructicola TaxID=38448 RepID=A0A5M9JJG0_MONFR|nr:hypothetical protein EYC84_007775 [Monilinia fructicola]